MSLAKSTIGIGRVLEGLTAGRTGRKGVVVLLLVLTGLLIIAGGLLVTFEQPITPVLAVFAAVITVVTFSILVIRHEWLLILAMIIGHTVFYGKLGQQLGMRIKDSVGPSDLLFFLAFVGAIVYWFGAKEKPHVPRAFVYPPLLLFLYGAGYILIAFFLWDKQDNALIQAAGWLYFALALPTYLCLVSGRIWKPFFITVFAALIVGGIFSSMLEVQAGTAIVNKVGYGGIGMRSFGDLSVKTNMLGLTVFGVLLATVVAAFAKHWFWKSLSVLSGLSGLLIIFLDRGRIHYAGIAVALFFIFVFLPGVTRVTVVLRFLTGLLLAILLLAAFGGELRDKAYDAVDKAWTRIQLSRPEAVVADQGLTTRMNRQRQAMVVFRENPVFGAGPGVRFGYEFDWQQMQQSYISFMDNSWVFPLAVGGLVGLGLIMACYIAFMWATIAAYIKLRNPLHKALALIPIGIYLFLLTCSTVTWWMVDRYHVAVFAFAAALALALVHHERVNGSDVPVIDF